VNNRKRILLTDFTGLSNRLEALTLAHAISERFGHEIFLDWPELDSLTIEDVKSFSYRLWDKLSSTKIRGFDNPLFKQASRINAINLREVIGPEHLFSKMDEMYLYVASTIHIKKPLAEALLTQLSPYRDRPVVGVHIRRGDFRLASGEIYDASLVRHPAVPIWWYERMMDEVVSRNKDTVFFLSCTGDPAEYSSLLRKYEIVESGIPSTYGYKGLAHRSHNHPVADMFALACCRTIISTPISSFSHFSANALGAGSDSILPPIKMTISDPTGYDVVNLYGHRLPKWLEVCRKESERRKLALRDILVVPPDFSLLEKSLEIGG